MDRTGNQLELLRLEGPHRITRPDNIFSSSIEPCEQCQQEIKGCLVALVICQDKLRSDSSWSKKSVCSAADTPVPLSHIRKQRLRAVLHALDARKHRDEEAEPLCIGNIQGSFILYVESSSSFVGQVCPLFNDIPAQYMFRSTHFLEGTLYMAPSLAVLFPLTRLSKDSLDI